MKNFKKNKYYNTSLILKLINGGVLSGYDLDNNNGDDLLTSLIRFNRKKISLFFLPNI